MLDDDPLLVKACVEHGQDINKVGRGGQTPLVHAILNGKIQVVRWLLEVGADTKIPEDNGYTPMQAAAFSGNAEIIDILVKHGLNPSEAGLDG